MAFDSTYELTYDSDGYDYLGTKVVLNETFGHREFVVLIESALLL